MYYQNNVLLFFIIIIYDERSRSCYDVLIILYTKFVFIALSTSIFYYNYKLNELTNRDNNIIPLHFCFIFLRRRNQRGLLIVKNILFLRFDLK